MPRSRSRAPALASRHARRFTRSRRRIVLTIIFIVLDIAAAVYLWVATSSVNFSL